MGRLGSGVWVSASFQIFALTARGNVLGLEGNCPGVGNTIVIENLIFCASSLYPIISFVDCVLNIRPSIELCRLGLFDLSCKVLFCYFFLCFVFCCRGE